MENRSKRTSIRLIALIISFSQGICTSKTAASELSETELRAVISTWQNVRQIIEKGAPIKDSVPGYRVGCGPAGPMAKELKVEILHIGREVERWREPWFVVTGGEEWGRETTVFFAPDEVRGRLRRGKFVSISLWHARMRAAAPEIEFHFFSVHDYAQIGEESPAAFVAHHKNAPFDVPGDLTLGEIGELVELIRAPSKPVDPVEIRARHRSDPILSIRRVGERVYVMTGHVLGVWCSGGQDIQCKKVDGVWVITEVCNWVS